MCVCLKTGQIFKTNAYEITTHRLIISNSKARAIEFLESQMPYKSLFQKENDTKQCNPKRFHVNDASVFLCCAIVDDIMAKPTLNLY